MKRFLALCLLGCGALPAQQTPGATDLPGDPFFVKKTWVIGGIGNWDYLTMDPVARQLFIAHGSVVQVVDVETGTLAGQVTGLRGARAIALDDAGQFGYVSDGPAGQVKVFDRHTFALVAAIPTGPAPRALVFDPQNRLLFAVCTAPVTETQAQPSANRLATPPNSAASAGVRNGLQRTAAGGEIRSSVTVIDAETRQPLGEILMPGRLGFAQTDGHGQIFINIMSRNQVARLDAQSIAALLGRRADRVAAAQTAVAQAAAAHPAPAQPNPAHPNPAPSGPAKQTAAPQVLDWSHESSQPNSADSRLLFFQLGPACLEPSALAVDGGHQRLFVACNNRTMAVLNADTGELVASLPTGPGTEAIGYDAGRGLIYAANGGANGSLTIVRQDVTDTYAVIQNLPTRQRARTLAVNTATGEVYLVTDLLGVNLAEPGGIGTLKTAPMSGSFQVLAVGH